METEYLLKLYLRNVRCFKAFQKKVLPVDLFEETMLLNISSSIFKIAIAF